MSATYKGVSISWLMTIAFWVVMAGSAWPYYAQAAPCFDDPQAAYDYLMAQEAAVTQARDQATVNINRATEGELVSLQGIGSSKAQAIILYRDMFGEFQTVEELARVKGIGAATIDKNRARLTVGE